MNPKIALFKKQVTPALPEFYYHKLNRSFLFKQEAASGTREWIEVNDQSAADILSLHGVSKSKNKEDDLSEAGRELSKCKLDPARTVRYAGPLGGYYEGLTKMGDFNALITSSPRVLKPVKGDCDMIIKIISSLFGGVRNGVQVPFVFAYLYLSLEMLLAENRRGMPILVMVGPQNCGKSFFQTHIMTPLLGGRESNASACIAEGKTKFNVDLFQTEHLKIEDPELSPMMHERQKFGERMKSLVAVETQAIEGKFRDVLHARPFSRCSMSLNDKFETNMRFPPMTADLADKVIIMRCSPVEWPVRAVSPQERLEFERLVESQIPAFMWWLLNEYKLPASLTVNADGTPTRWGMRCYHDPDFLRALTEVSPEFRLLELIRSCFLVPPSSGKHKDDVAKVFAEMKVCMSALELEQGLKDDSSPVRVEARSLLPNGRCVNAYLARLHERFPNMVYTRLVNGRRKWVLEQIDAILDDGLQIANNTPVQQEGLPL